MSLDSKPASAAPGSDNISDWSVIFGWQMPVGILLFTLLLTNLYQMKMQLDQQSQLNTNKGQIDQALPRAQVVQTKLQGLASDLLDLARTNVNAKQIQDELHIQVADNSQNGAQPNAAISTGPISPPASVGSSPATK